LKKTEELPTPAPHPKIILNSINITEESSDCMAFRCEAAKGAPILVATENRINKTTYRKWNMEFNLPECPITEIDYDANYLQEEARLLQLNNFENYFVLHYFIPLSKGTYLIKIKNSCQLRGNTYTLIAT
jgi:hypothetical protein